MNHGMDNSEFNLTLKDIGRHLINLPEYIIVQRKNQILGELGLHHYSNKKLFKKEKQNG